MVSIQRNKQYLRQLRALISFETNVALSIKFFSKFGLNKPSCKLWFLQLILSFI